MAFEENEDAHTATEAAHEAPPACSIKHDSYFDGKHISDKHRKLFGVIMLAYFFEQMDNMNFGYVAQAMFDSWNLTTVQSNNAMGLILSFYFVGMTLGGFLGGMLSDLIGRRKTFLGAILLFSSCSIITGLPLDNLYVFIIARALTGFGVFCMMVCSQVYIAEMTPADSRGKWQGIIGTVGFCAIPVVGLICTIVIPLSPSAWRLIFFFGGTGFIAYLLGVKYLMESPRWLVSQGRVQEAERVVTYFTGESCSLQAVAAKNCDQKPNVKENLLGIVSNKYIGRTLLLLLVFVCLAPSNFIFSTWLPKLLQTIYVVDPENGEFLRAFSQREALAMMTAVTCGNPLGCFISSRIADFGGRKIPLALCMGIAAAACMAFAFAPVNGILLVMLGLIICAMGMAATMIMMTYTAEHFPTRMRNTATGTLNGSGRLAVSGMQMVIPVLLLAFGANASQHNPDVRIVLTVCGILMVIPIPFILKCGQRTGGKPLEEIS